MSLAWLAALALFVSGPPRASFEVTHLPKLAVLLVLASALSSRLRRRPLPVDAIDLLGAGVVLGVAVSAALAVSPAYALRPTLLVVGTLVIAFAVRADGHRRWQWLEWLGIAVGVIALLGLLESLGLWSFFSQRGRAPASVMGQRNTLAHLLALGSPLIWALASRSSSEAERGEGPRNLQLPRIVWVAIAGVIAFVVIATRCRAAYLAGPVAVGLFAAFAARARSSRPALLALIGITTAAVVVAGLAPVALEWTSPTPYADSARQLFDTSAGSGAGRLAQWRHSLQLFSDHPVLGAGPGNWFVTANEAGHFANSDFVALAVERGALGLATVLALFVAVLHRWWRAPRTIDGLPVVLATGSALLIVGALDAVTQLPAALLLVTLVFSVGLPRESPRAQLSARLAGPALAVLFALGALSVTSSFASRLYSNAEATPFATLERAATLDPLDGELRLTLSEAYVSAHRCDEARPHLAALRRLLPMSLRGGELSAACAP